MKIQIEIEDSLLRSAVEQQVGVVLAQFTGEALNKMATEVIAKKMARFDPYEAAARTVQEAVGAQIKMALSNALGQTWDQRTSIKNMLADEIAKTLKGVLK